MTPTHRSRIRAATAALLVPLLAACATTDAGHAWPPTLIGVDQMRPLQRIQTSLLVHRMANSPAATVVLRLHVDEAGHVVRAEVEESSGLPRVDGAAMGAMRKMTFAPYTRNGTAVPVTVIAPMHFPAVR